MPVTTGQPVRPSDLEEAIANELDATAHIGELVGYTEETSDSSTFTAETQVSSVTFSEVAGYTYMIECGAQFVSSTVTDTVQATLREDTSGGAERHSGRYPAQSSDSARPVIIDLALRYVATATGSKTFVITLQRIAGGGNVRREAATTHPMLTTVILRSKS